LWRLARVSATITNETASHTYGLRAFAFPENRAANNGAPQAPIASNDPNRMIASKLDRPSRAKYTSFKLSHRANSSSVSAAPITVSNTKQYENPEHQMMNVTTVHKDIMEGRNAMRYAIDHPSHNAEGEKKAYRCEKQSAAGPIWDIFTKHRP
jgi:hypothetical protein